MIDDAIIEDIRHTIDMRTLAEHFGLRVSRKGFARCPFHNEKTGSMKIYPGDRGYYCFGCGAGGSIFNFVMEYCGLNYEDAVRYIASEFGIAIPDSRKPTKREWARINHKRILRETDEAIYRAEISMLSATADELRSLEWIMTFAEPFGDLFCYAANRISVLQRRWEWLYDHIEFRNIKE